jgi:hypothetical protein
MAAARTLATPGKVLSSRESKDRARHSLTSPSWLQEARDEPSGANTIPLIWALCPRKLSNSCPMSGPHRRIVPDFAADLTPSDDVAAVVSSVGESSSDPPPGGTTPPPAPAYVGEQRLYSGKGARRKLVGFQLKFRGALDLATGSARSHYRLTQPGRTKRSAPKVIPVKSIRISADGLVVTLTPGKYDIRKSLQLTIAGLIGAQAQAVATIVIKLQAGIE